MDDGKELEVGAADYKLFSSFFVKMHFFKDLCEGYKSVDEWDKFHNPRAAFFGADWEGGERETYPMEVSIKKPLPPQLFEIFDSIDAGYDVLLDAKQLMEYGRDYNNLLILLNDLYGLMTQYYAAVFHKIDPHREHLAVPYGKLVVLFPEGSPQFLPKMSIWMGEKVIAPATDLCKEMMADACTQRLAESSKILEYNARPLMILSALTIVMESHDEEGGALCNPFINYDMKYYGQLGLTRVYNGLKRLSSSESIPDFEPYDFMADFEEFKKHLKLTGSDKAIDAEAFDAHYPKLAGFYEQRK